MKALLLYPRFPDTFWSFKHALKFIRKQASLPPLGLATVGALLPEEWSVRLIDTNVRELGDGDLAWADMAFVGGMAVQADSARALIRRCRCAGVPVVAGGPLFTAEPERFPEVEHLVLGEAEVTLPAFLRDLRHGRARRVYRSAEVPDMRCSPIPRWDLVELRRYASMSVQFSRGCPYDCDFCNVTALFGRRPRTKTAAQVIAELDTLWRLGWRGAVFFVDDNLIGHRRRLVEELLPALAAWQRRGRRIPFYTEASINLADDEDLLAAMREAGFDTVFVGIETPDEEALAECSKHQNRRRDLVADVRRIQRSGIQVQAGFIVGFDSDTPSVFRRQIDFIQRSGIVTAMVGMLQAPAGTRLYERMQREGRLLGRLSGDNVAGTTNILPRMGLETLRRGYRELMEQLYCPANYYRRLRTFLREYRAPAIRARLDRQRVLAFMRSWVRLGVLGRERFHYWGLLLWTLWRRPRLLPVAVTLAIHGYHFRKVCELRVAPSGGSTS